MVPAAIIAKKRDGGQHAREDIEAMVAGFVSGEVADYQMAAWAMAIVCRGMNDEETACLTSAMLHSGARLPRVTDRPRVDKHSTGGLGDSPSIILAPLLACFDLDVPMLSGRGLGITGGTLDKLEAFPGYRTNLSIDEMSQQLRAIGCFITGTTPEIAPADRKLYALRDVTGTVESISLITASIMSKKLAESLDALVLDVKFGSGAFMQKLDDARGLAGSLVRTGQREQLATSAVLTSMEEPLGRMVGNACEINESIEVLQGSLDNRLAIVTLRLCAELLVMTNKASDLSSAEEALRREIASGRPLERLQQMVEAQSGKFAVSLPLAKSHTICVNRDGFIGSFDGRRIGQAIIELGGGRKAMGEAIDPRVGLEFLVRLGSPVRSGQPILNLFCDDDVRRSAAEQLIDSAYTIVDTPSKAVPLIL